MQFVDFHSFVLQTMEMDSRYHILAGGHSMEVAWSKDSKSTSDYRMDIHKDSMDYRSSIFT